MAKPKSEGAQQEVSSIDKTQSFIQVTSAFCHQAHMVPGVGTVTHLVKAKIPSLTMHLEGDWLICEAKGKKFAIPSTNLTGVNF